MSSALTWNWLNNCQSGGQFDKWEIHRKLIRSTGCSKIPLYSLQHYVVDNGFTTADDFTETSVRIKKLGRRQTGKYYCRAQNKLGSAEREFRVTETYEPNCVVGLCGDFSAGSISLKESLFTLLITLSISLMTVKWTKTLVAISEWIHSAPPTSPHQH